VIDIALARTAFEEDRNREQLLAVLNGTEQARRRAFANVPLAMKIFVMALAGGGEVGVNVEFVAFDADFAVDHSAAARVIGETESNVRFGWHDEFLLY
jgi:hypothetical protein